MLKRIIGVIIACFPFSILLSQAPTTSPSETTEVCPNTDIVLNISIPEKAQSVTAYGWADIVPVTSVQPPYDVAYDSNPTTFKVRVRFADVNNTQAFQIRWFSDVDQVFKEKTFKFTKVKSLLTPANSSDINVTTPAFITVPFCQVQNVNLSFTKVKYNNASSNPEAPFGTVDTYEWLLPAGWILNGATSNGTNWLPGDNNETLTSGPTTGGSLKIRPVNACGSTLAKGGYREIAISRPIPVFDIVGSSDICSGTKPYNILTTNPITWTSSNTSLLTITPSTTNGSPATATKIGTGDGTVTITAVVNVCGQSVTATKVVRVGSPNFPYSVTGASPVLLNAGGYGYQLNTNPSNLALNNIVWTVPAGWTIQLGQGTKLMTAYTGSMGGGYVQVSFNDACGTNRGSFKYVTIGSGSPLPERAGDKVAKKNEAINTDGEWIKLYPNPATESLKIAIPVEIAGGYAEISDAKGVVMLRVALTGQLTTANVSMLKKGTYIVHIINDKEIRAEKFIKH
jgi:hypothetical protein